jgi:hypothetical protein
MLEMAGISTTGVAIVLIAYRFLKTMRGKKFVSSCCGRKMDIGFDVTDISPSTSSSTLKIPSTSAQTQSSVSSPPSSAVAPQREESKEGRDLPQVA